MTEWTYNGVMATVPNPKKTAAERLQSAFGELVRDQMETMTEDEIRSARKDMKEIATKARAARASRHGKVK